MILEFTYDDPIAGEITEQFAEGEYKFREIPDLSRESDPFDFTIDCQSLTLVFVWDNNSGSDWDVFLRDKRKIVESIKIYNNAGDELYFSGVIEPESEIIANYADKSVVMSFINENVEMLESTTTLGAINGDFETIWDFVMDSLFWLDSCEYPEMIDWGPCMPLDAKYIEMYGSRFDHILYMCDFTGMSNAEVLRTILILGFAQVYVYGETQKVVCYGMLTADEVSGIRLINNTYMTSISSISYLPGIDEVYLKLSDPTHTVPLLVYPSAIREHMAAMFSRDKYEAQVLSEKPEIGEVIEYNGDAYLVTSWRPDLRFIEEEQCPLNLTLLKLVSE